MNTKLKVHRIVNQSGGVSVLACGAGKMTRAGNQREATRDGEITCSDCKKTEIR